MCIFNLLTSDSCFLVVFSLVNNSVDHRYKPMKQTTGATLIRIVLKISSLNAVSSELAPLISIKPMITISMLTAKRMKFILPKA